MFPLDEYDQGTTSSTGAAGVGGLGGEPQGGQAHGGQPQGGQPEGGGGSTPVCDGGPNPPLSDVVSDFDAGLGPSLALLNCAAIEAGELVVEDTAGQFCWAYTTGSHSLRCDSVTFKVQAAGNQQAGVQAFVYLREPDGPGDMALLQENNGFSFQRFTFADDSFQLPRDTWWRLSADQDDVITFETSTNATDWVVRASGPATFALTNVTINIGGGNYLSVVDPGVARFDCLNVPPPCGE